MGIIFADHIRVGKIEEAIMEGQILLAEDPIDIQLAIRLALLLFRIGDPIAAKKALLSASLFAQKVAPEPKIVQLELTRLCNLQCEMCPRTRSLLTSKSSINDYWYRSIQFDLVKRIVEKSQSIEAFTLHGIGEPLLYAHFLDILLLLRSRGLETGFFTNGMLLDSDKRLAIVRGNVSQVTISIDGATAKTFESIRKGRNSKFELMMNNIRELQSLKTERQSGLPQLAFHITLCKKNQKEIPHILDLANNLEIPEISISPIDPPDDLIIFYQQNPDELSRDLDLWRKIARSHSQRFNAIGFELGFLQEKNIQSPGFCMWLWIGVYVSVEGRVLPCCHLPNIKRYALGDLTKQPLDEIWNGLEYTSFRQMILEGKSPFEFCFSCPYYLVTKTD
jgi:radical SAM protein with 4Fe4S-binding SPASM domain